VSLDKNVAFGCVVGIRGILLLKVKEFLIEFGQKLVIDDVAFVYQANQKIYPCHLAGQFVARAATLKSHFSFDLGKACEQCVAFMQTLDKTAYTKHFCLITNFSAKDFDTTKLNRAFMTPGISFYFYNLGKDNLENICPDCMIFNSLDNLVLTR
jgi:hypothetical protein